MAELKPVLEQYADQIVAQMKAIAPVLKEPDARRRAGALRDSIGWTWGAAPKGTFKIANVAVSKNAEARITIYAGSRDKKKGKDDAFYVHFQEFGTVDQAAQPFFFPTWRANRSRVRAGVTRAVNRGLKKL